jgi:hypothetical protein
MQELCAKMDHLFSNGALGCDRGHTGASAVSAIQSITVPPPGQVVGATAIRKDETTPLNKPFLVWSSNDGAPYMCSMLAPRE